MDQKFTESELCTFLMLLNEELKFTTQQILIIGGDSYYKDYIEEVIKKVENKLHED